VTDRPPVVGIEHIEQHGRARLQPRIAHGRLQAFGKFQLLIHAETLNFG
jgi:hypothetical protein